MPKKRNPRFQITLPEKYTRLLNAYCDVSGEAPATFSAILVRNELDRLQQSGELKLDEALSEALSEIELLKAFIIALTNGDDDFDASQISESTGIDSHKLEALQNQCLCNSRTPKRSAFKKKETKGCETQS